MICMKFPRGMILRQEELLYYIINEDTTHVVLQGLPVIIVSPNEAIAAPGKDFVCFKNTLCENREEYFMVDCRKSKMLNNNDCNYICSTDNKIFSLCVTAFMLNSFGISPMEFMTDIAKITKEETKKNETVEIDKSEELEYNDPTNITLEDLARAFNNNDILPELMYKVAAALYEECGCYGKMYGLLYTRLYNVSESRMREIYKKSEKMYNPQHTNKKE